MSDDCIAKVLKKKEKSHSARRRGRLNVFFSDTPRPSTATSGESKRQRRVRLEKQIVKKDF